MDKDLEQFIKDEAEKERIYDENEEQQFDAADANQDREQAALRMAKRLYTHLSESHEKEIAELKTIGMINDYEAEKLYDWIIDGKRKPAITSFTASKARDIAREVEFQIKSLTEQHEKDLQELKDFQFIGIPIVDNKNYQERLDIMLESLKSKMK